MLLPILISALVGGIIGYSTNWLAIKMLFRPLREKYIGPLRIPFTPGLIPKRRAELARSLGHTVAQYLVTPGTLTTAFSHPQVTQRLESFLTDTFAKLRTEKRPLAELLEGTDLRQYLEDWTEQLAGQVLQLAAQRATDLLHNAGRDLPWEALAPSLTSFFSALFSSNPMRQQLLEQLEDMLNRIQSDEDRRLADVLPLRLQEAIHNCILTDSPQWLDWLYEQLQQPASKHFIESLIQQVLSGSTMLRLLSAFADAGKLADSLVGSLRKAEVRTQIVTHLLVLWQRLLDQPLAPLAARVKIRSLSFAGIYESPQFQAALQDKLALILNTSANAIEADQLLAGKLEQLTQEILILFLTSPTSKQALASALRSLLQMTPAQLLATLEFPEPSVLAPRIQEKLRQTVAANGSELLKLLRLTEVVEAQVNDLDIVQVEEILLKVMRDQLTAITNLGFLLGALIGAFTPLLNKLLEL